MALKRTGFKQPTYEEALAKKRKATERAILRKKERDASKSTKGTKPTLKRKNTPNKGKSKSLPAWLKAIPESQAHGSGTYQKRLWRVTSDYVRIRDFYTYQVCVATGKGFTHWKEAHAGHLKPYSNCNGIYKFDVRNIHMQHGNSNKWGNRDTWIDFEKVVRNRGYDFDGFERDNRKAIGARLYDSEVEEQIKKMLKLMEKLPEKPDYFERAYSLSTTLI